MFMGDFFFNQASSPSVLTGDFEPFSVLVGHLYISFGEMSIQVLCPFLNEVVCFYVVIFRDSLYILNINPLSDGL